MRKYQILLILFVSLSLLFCSKNTTEIDPDPDVDYSTINDADIKYADHVQPILTEYKTLLEAEDLYPAGLQSDSWENLIKGWERGEVVIPYDASNSLLIEIASLITGADSLRTDKLDLLTRWINLGAKNDNGDVPYAGASNLLWVCSQGEGIINIIDMDAMVVVRNIHLNDPAIGLPSASQPHHVAFSPDGQYAYVSCINNSVNKVLKFNAITYEYLGSVTTNIPALLAHHPTEDILYVSRFMMMNSLTSIFALNTATMQGIDNGNNGDIILPPSQSVPHAMSLTSNGDYAFTSSFTEDYFLVVDHAQKDFSASLYLGQDVTPLQGTVSPNDQWVYQSCIGNSGAGVAGRLLAIDISDPANPMVADSILTGGAPWHSVFSADGNTLYAGNLMMNNFAVVNTTDNSFATYGAGDGSDGLSQPHGIGMSADGQYVFISGRNTNGNYQSPYVAKGLEGECNCWNGNGYQYSR